MPALSLILNVVLGFVLVFSGLILAAYGAYLIGGILTDVLR